MNAKVERILTANIGERVLLINVTTKNECPGEIIGKTEQESSGEVCFGFLELPRFGDPKPIYLTASQIISVSVVCNTKKYVYPAVTEVRFREKQ